MRVTTAMLPEASSSQDRILTTSDAVVVLDGASAFVPVEVSPATYVDTLGGFLVEGLTADPRAELVLVLGRAIERTATSLGLRVGASPSSTVAIARQDGDVVDLLVLGDTQIATLSGIVVDERLTAVASAQRAAYLRRLAVGHGYDATHRDLLRALQAEQARHRNVEGGYWIAEAVPEAAAHAVTARLPVAGTPWLVMATDGAHRPMQHLRLDDWAGVARLDHRELHDRLTDLQRWEADDDPQGLALPRAKRHDDKSLAIAHPRVP